MNTANIKEKGIVPAMSSIFDGFFNRDDDFISGFKRKIEFPVVNVSETETAFKLEVAAPGMKREDFKIELEENTLIISSELKEEYEEVEKNYTSKEYSYESFKRSFWMPENAKAEAIGAIFMEGVLEINIPKTKIVLKEKKTIEIG